MLFLACVNRISYSMAHMAIGATYSNWALKRVGTQILKLGICDNTVYKGFDTM